MLIETKFKPGQEFATIDLTKRRIITGTVGQVKAYIRPDGTQLVLIEAGKDTFPESQCWHSKDELLADLQR